MLKETIAKFGTVIEGKKQEGMKECYILQMDGLNQKDAVNIEVSVDENDLVSINNKNYPIELSEEKDSYLSELFDEEYTITKENHTYVYDVKTKGNYFPSLYLEDIKSFYEKLIDQFGEL